MDVAPDAIPVGEYFDDVLWKQVSACDVMVVIIGRRWLALLAERDSSELDYVVLEITQALRQKKRVIPVLVGNAAPPAANVLPPELQDLPRLQAATLTPERWEADCGEFIQKLRRLIAESPGKPEAEGQLAHPPLMFEPRRAVRQSIPTQHHQRSLQSPSGETLKIPVYC